MIEIQLQVFFLLLLRQAIVDFEFKPNVLMPGWGLQNSRKPTLASSSCKESLPGLLVLLPAWGKRLQDVCGPFTNISKLSLSIFGREAAGFGYGTGKLLYRAGLSAIPEEGATELDAWTKALARL